MLQSKQNSDMEPLWSMLGGESINGEEAQTAFQRIMNKLLNINLKVKDIYPVYDYFHNTKNKLNYVFYAEIRNTRIIGNPKNSNFSWFTFSETLKLPFTRQTKQDIIVGERVINAKWRDDEAKKLLTD